MIEEIAKMIVTIEEVISRLDYGNITKDEVVSELEKIQIELADITTSE